MRKIKNYILVIILMLFISGISLFVLGLLTYMQKWQADKALVGVVAAYILAGYFGGLFQKIINKETRENGKKIAEGIITASGFMLVLTCLCVFGQGGSLVFSTRFFMIWALLVGSACLGRIL